MVEKSRSSVRVDFHRLLNAHLGTEFNTGTISCTILWLSTGPNYGYLAKFLPVKASVVPGEGFEPPTY